MMLWIEQLKFELLFCGYYLYLWKNPVPVCFWKGMKMAKTGWFWSFLKHSRTGGFHERINDSMIDYFFFSII
jgi:hypothetical protein